MSSKTNKAFVFLLLKPLLIASIFINICLCVPFVTKRVSLHNPINIDFSGWIPLRPQSHSNTEPNADLDMTGSQQQSSVTQQQLRPELDSHYLTVPVAVETDFEHTLSETDLNQIREQVINNWNQKPNPSHNLDSNPIQLKPILSKLVPKPEIIKEVIEEVYSKPEESKEIKHEVNFDNSNQNLNETEYTFVKMDKTLMKTQNETENENLFHAYFAPKDHIPPEGYIKLTKNEFKNLFKNAEILFV